MPQPPRLESGYRQYSCEAVKRIRFIKRAQELGFSLNEIGELLSLRVNPQTSSGDIKRRVDTKITAIDARIHDLKRMKEALMKLASACRGRGPTSECPILDALESQES